MEILPLDCRLEDIFWSYVYQDVSHHHFFILDWKFEKNSTKILCMHASNGFSLNSETDGLGGGFTHQTIMSP